MINQSTPKVTIGALFLNKVIRTILMSAFLLQIGIWVRNYAILLYVMEQTNEDPVAVSLISVAEFAPIFLFSFVGGTYADRWRPKRTMIWCDFLSSVSIFFVMLALMFGSWKVIFFATLISSILSQFSQPSGMKLFKTHVSEQLIQLGMSMYQTIYAVFMILGPIIGTFVYQNFGITAAIGVMGIAFLLSAAVLLWLPPDHEIRKHEEKTTIWQEMKEGIRYVLDNRYLTALGGCFAMAGLAIGITQPVAVFIITEQLGLPKEQLQWLMAAYGVGMILGGGVAMGAAKKIEPLKLLMVGLIINAGGFIVVGLSSHLSLTLTAQFIAGLFMPGISIGINTLILKNSKTEFVGRVNGILNPLFTGAMVLMMTIAGWLKTTFSIVALYEAAAVLFVMGVIFLLPMRKEKAVREE